MEGLVGRKRRGHRMGHPLGPELKKTDLREVQMDGDSGSDSKGCVLEWEEKDQVQMRAPVCLTAGSPAVAPTAAVPQA